MGDGGGVPVVGGFSDLVEVGRGGFSRVFSAYQVEFDRRVALKVLNDRLADDASVAVFEGECRAMGTLSQHPFIVTVLASALTADYRPCIVMELFERGNYMQLLRRDGPLPLEELLSLAVRVAGALATAHHHGVIHGDVKPQNILKSEFGYPALGDFGIATLRGRLSERAGTGLSAHYAAPEMIESGAIAAGAAADQYSLAATIFTLACGRRPFEGATAGEAPERVLARVLAAPTPRLAATFPQDLADTLARAMSRDPHHRFPDLAALAFALTAVEHQLGYRATAVPLASIDDDATITIDHPSPPPPPQQPPPPSPPPSQPSPPSPASQPPGDEHTIAIASQPPESPAPPQQPNRRRRITALLALLLAAAGAAAYVTLGSDITAEPDTTTSAASRQTGATAAADAASETSQPALSSRDESAPSDLASASESTPLFIDAGGVLTLTVSGTDYVLPGPPGGVRGALLPDEVVPWTYDFDAATFVADDSPAAPFDPSIRQASRNYEIAWVSPIAAAEAAQDIEDAIRSTAAASGARIGVICDGALDPERMLACADSVAGSDADAVIFGNVFGEVAAPAMEVFDEAGLPVVTFDVWHPNAVLVGANSYESGAVAGVNAGRHALEAWGCAGVHVLLGDAANVSGRDNLNLALTGFADGVRAVCGADVPVSRLEKASDIAAPTADWLAANPTVGHVVATSVTDDLTVDMSRALQQTRRSGIAAAPNAGPAGAARLSEGPPSETRYLGAAATLLETYGTNAVAALIDILEGRPVPQEIHLNHTWINHTNTDQNTNPQDPANPNSDTPPDNTFTAISAGPAHTCGLRTDGTAQCWGKNANGETDAPDGVTFTAVTAGDGHSCALRVDGTAQCWGSNRSGRTDVPVGVIFTAIDAGDSHSCGLRVDGTAQCWGSNHEGQSNVPVGVTFTAIDAGDSHSCGLRVDGTAQCWGANDFSQIDVPDGVTFIDITAGAGQTCGLRVDGTAQCWGWNGDGETDVPGGVTFAVVTAGYGHSCGLRVDGTAQCWGGNGYSQIDVPDGVTFIDITAGNDHTCGLRVDGAAQCWGSNYQGRSDVPVR